MKLPKIFENETFKTLFKGLDWRKVLFYLLVLAAAVAALAFLARAGSGLAGSGKGGGGTEEAESAGLAAGADVSKGELEEREEALEKRLEELLGLIKGAGKVRVMVNLAYDPEGDSAAVNETEKHASTVEADAEGGERRVSSAERQTSYVILKGGNGVETPLIIKPQGYIIEGVAIVAEGGDSIAVRDALTRAAYTVLGIPSHRVQVVRMK